jgi:hypothetical protein
MYLSTIDLVCRVSSSQINVSQVYKETNWTLR